jgi:heat shock protein HslJ/uncharacterized membrane protein
MTEMTPESAHGQYEGYLPCADCPGIEYKLLLNSDGTYAESLFYTDRPEQPFLQKSTYAVDGNMVVLDKSEAGMKYFALHPQGLLMLDVNRKPIAGSLSYRYILTRTIQPSETIFKTETRTFMKRKLAEGIDLYALGNEPSWSIDIDFEKFMRFKSLTELSELNTPPGKEIKAQDANLTRYGTQTEAGMLIATILKGPCTDSMSGEIFPWKVRVDAKYTTDTDYKQFKGCGRYMVDYRLNDIWVLTTFNGNELKAEDFVKGQPVVEFHLDENRVYGSTGCNRINGSFEVKGKKITFGKIATTRMACPNMDFEQQFLTFITDNTLDYSIEAGILTLQDDKGIVMVFEKTD